MARDDRGGGRLTARSGRRFRLFAGLSVALFAFLTACAKNAPQDTLQPEGPIARQQDNLFRPVFWIAVVIFVIVEGLIVIAVVKFRRRSESDVPVQTHGNQRLEVAWTIAPAVLLAGIAIPTVLTIFDIDRASDPSLNPMRVKVTAAQWWWRYDYLDIKLPGTEAPLVTANELHIPVGKRVRIELESRDVIHSFWVPKLAGKQDVVPGRLNHLTIEAEEPGEYLGQCAEFCALSHANMRLRVIAQTPAEFERWVSEQKSPANPDAGQSGGAQVFFGAGNCFQCHTIRGLEVGGQSAGGQVGPDLTHISSRGTFGGAMYTFDAQNLTTWLRDPEAAKPGNLMKNCDPGETASCVPDLSESDIRLLVEFLQSLG
jgi:cytochrome c oxidase subunit 2